MPLRALRVLPARLDQRSASYGRDQSVYCSRKRQAPVSAVRNIAWHDNIDYVPDGPDHSPRVFRVAAITRW